LFHDGLFHDGLFHDGLFHDGFVCLACLFRFLFYSSFALYSQDHARAWSRSSPFPHSSDCGKVLQKLPATADNLACVIFINLDVDHRVAATDFFQLQLILALRSGNHAVRYGPWWYCFRRFTWTRHSVIVQAESATFLFVGAIYLRSTNTIKSKAILVGFPLPNAVETSARMCDAASSHCMPHSVSILPAGGRRPTNSTLKGREDVGHVGAYGTGRLAHGNPGQATLAPLDLSHLPCTRKWCLQQGKRRSDFGTITKRRRVDPAPRPPPSNFVICGDGEQLANP
jgi:hypothetical protein